ncbi:hypothetical protein BUE80_DR012258, partial [Diplocarpon rosae]
SSGQFIAPGSASSPPADPALAHRSHTNASPCIEDPVSTATSQQCQRPKHNEFTCAVLVYIATCKLANISCSSQIFLCLLQHGAEQSGIPCPQPPDLHHDSGELQLRSNLVGATDDLGTLCHLQDLCYGTGGGHLHEMPAAASLPRRLKLATPENAYEPPGSPEDGQMFDKSCTEADSGSADTSRSNHSVDVLKNASEGSVKIGIWNRIRRFAQIWSTMMMAIGGIANVLHGILLILLMTSNWIFLAYPLLLVAPLAGNLTNALSNSEAATGIVPIAIAFGAFCVQGASDDTEAAEGDGVFAGPPGFIVAGKVHLGDIVVPRINPNEHLGNDNAAFFIKPLYLLMRIITSSLT